MVGDSDRGCITKKELLSSKSDEKELIELKERSILAFVAGQEFNAAAIVTYKKTNSKKYEGKFCSVQYGELVKDEKPIIVKTLKKEGRNWPKEFSILNKLEPHDNIIKLLYYSFGYQKTWIHLIFEGVHQTLRDLMHEYRSQSIHPTYIKAYLFQLFRALGYLHSNNICHRDVKPENILVDTQNKLLKLANFRHGKVLDDGVGSYCCAGTTVYKSPEIILFSPRYNLLTDMWSAGCVMGELLNDNEPLIEGENLNEVFVSIQKLLGSPTCEDLKELGVPHDYIHCVIPKKIYPTIKLRLRNVNEEDLNFLKELLQYCPSKRPTAYSVFHRKFFSKLRDPTLRFPDGTVIPNFFEFTDQELCSQPDLEWICTNHT
ncbi:hypothetical protein O3M35_010535 [Rhynocoris fuscipes]|uniref:Protein kinase domain-containing protein n=1 Tax=Rhynocoris fuscipes TaxID=488301 RepID=A0AAW1D5E6_9HEMI